MKKTAPGREPVKVTSFTWILRCICGQRIHRDIVPGWPRHNKSARRDLADFQARHSGKYCKVVVEKEGIMR